jgi:hypothetical protein
MTQPDQPSVHELQARAEGVELIDDLGIDFLGKRFRIREKVGLMPLMAFAMTADSGKDTDDMRALAALYRVLRSCIHRDDWAKFEDHAEETAADAEQLLTVVGATIAAVTARPTRRPAVSSAGPQTTSANSKVPSTLRLVQAQADDLEDAETMRARLTA